jgi:energy-coupling factor transporter ATP-binding protein EcfA2
VSLELIDLHKRYGDVAALDGLTMTVAAGRMHGFVGRNGAGKTTAMRVALGLVHPDAGKVRWRGAAPGVEDRRRFGYMPLSLLTMTGFFAAIFAQEDPTGVVARVGTFFPPSAPLVMPIRQAAGELPLWEAALGVALVLATIAVAIPLAGRIYAGGALFTRGRLRLRDAFARASE